ncbi:MAG: membrane protein insertion efficiency factor YidD [Anaerolineae bacterium]
MRFNLYFTWKVVMFLAFPLFLNALPGYEEPWGKDADLRLRQESQEEPIPPLSPMAWVAEKVILFHQNVLTKVDGPRSHFRPTSSRYMLLAIRRHGFLKGFVMGCDRLLRENNDPWVYRTIEIGGKLYKWDPPPP